MAQIYIANLGKYNEGYLVGDWIQLPFDEDEFNEFLEEKVGINEEYEEFAIHDTDDVPFEVSEYDNVLRVNEKYEQYEQVCMEHNEDAVNELIAYYDFEEAMNILENGQYMYYNGSMTMTDVAYDMVAEYGYPEDIKDYFDYVQFKNDLDYSCYFDDMEEETGEEMTEDEKMDYVYELVDELPHETLETYFDHEAFGYALECNGTFIYGDEGIIEVW